MLVMPTIKMLNQEDHEYGYPGYNLKTGDTVQWQNTQHMPGSRLDFTMVKKNQALEI